MFGSKPHLTRVQAALIKMRLSKNLVEYPPQNIEKGIWDAIMQTLDLIELKGDTT